MACHRESYVAPKEMAGQDGVHGFAGFRKDALRLAAGCFTIGLLSVCLDCSCFVPPFGESDKRMKKYKSELSKPGHVHGMLDSIDLNAVLTA